MPNRDRLRLDNDIKILQLLLKFGEKSKYGKKFVGYGQNKSFFDRMDIKKICSRKKFDGRRLSLLESRLISELQSKDGRENKYSITPLGILFLFNVNSINLDRHYVRRIFEIVNFHSLIKALPQKPTESNLFKQLLDEVQEDIILPCVYESLTNIRIEKSDKGVFIYSLDNFFGVMLSVDNMFSIVNSKIYTVSNFKEPFNVKDLTEITDLKFYKIIGKLIYHNIHLEIYKKLKDKTLPELYSHKILRSVKRKFIDWEFRNNDIEKILEKDKNGVRPELLRSIPKLLPNIYRVKTMVDNLKKEN